MLLMCVFKYILSKPSFDRASIQHDIDQTLHLYYYTLYRNIKLNFFHNKLNITLQSKYGFCFYIKTI